ncbi:MAG: chromate transporter [Sedimentisphaerales bacterium]|nr:chromate transporter [Sedimentisphaerales bacterium]
MALLHLFCAFFKVGLFAIGGAYSFLPLMQKEVVESHKWMDEDEFSHIVGMVELFPGAISIKFATYTGYKVAGVPGAIVANVANLLPPVLFMTVASLLYLRYGGVPAVKGALAMVRCAVIAMLIAIAIKLAQTHVPLSLKAVPVLVASFLLLTLTKIHPALVIIGAALYGGLVR